MATVYIKPGTGTGTGTASDPYFYSQLSTAETAATNSQTEAGTILFTDGTYPIIATTDWHEAGVTYKALNRHKAIVGESSIGSTGMHLFRLSNSGLSNVTLEGFILRNLKVYYRGNPTTVKGNIFEWTEPKDFATNGLFWIGGSSDQINFYDNSFKANQGGRTSENIGRNVGSNVQFERNSVYFEIDSATTLNTSDFLDIGSCKNNIFVGVGGTFSNTFTAISTNCCFHNFGSSNSSGGTNNVFADPQFIDVADLDFRLRPTSPCIGAGTAS